MAGHPLPVVFLGPSLPIAAAQEICEAVYLPPASQGAVMRAVERHRPRSILIIDGIFQSAPAVRHKEILWAMAQGVRVLGAASMGALRAAELHPYGMAGSGLIYRWYRRHAFAPDDAVAVLHMPEELGSGAMTVSLIDLRQTIKRAWRQGAIKDDERSRLETVAQGFHYRDRTLANVTEKAGVPKAEILELHLVEQKRRDAEGALRLLAKVNEEPPPEHAPFTWTTNFVRDLLVTNITPPGV